MTLAHSAVYVSGFMCGIALAIYMHNMYQCTYTCINKTDRLELCAPHNTHLSTTLNICIDLILTRRRSADKRSSVRCTCHDTDDVSGRCCFGMSTSGHSTDFHTYAHAYKRTHCTHLDRGECHRHMHIVFGTDIPHTHRNT